MRCDEIQERFVELLYNERGTPPASAELQAHVDSCPSCRRELDELKALQSGLKLWKDEPPVFSVVRQVPPRPVVATSSRYRLMVWAKYGAIAAMLVFAFLALANAEITWNKEGFSLQTHLWPAPSRRNDSNYYTKAEIRDLLRQVVDDSEVRITEGNRLMAIQMLEMVEQDMDRRLIRAALARSRSQN